MSFGALPTAERLEVLRLLTANMPMAPDVDLAAVAESMRCAAIPPCLGFWLLPWLRARGVLDTPSFCTADSFAQMSTEGWCRREAPVHE